MMRTEWPRCAALVLLVLATSGHRFANDFVFDDEEVIRQGALIHDPSRLGEVWTHHTMVASAADPGAVQSVDTYRPLTITLFMLNAQLSGRSPIGYHITNLLLHTGCVLLVFALGLLWLGREQLNAALYGAAVFAAHPWLVVAHVWIDGRSDPLALLFGLGAMAVLLRSAEQPRRRLAALGAGVLFLLGLLSKETLLMTAPAVILMPAVHGRPRAGRAELGRRTVAVLGASAIYLGARAVVLEGLATHRDGAMLRDAAERLPWLLVDSLRQSLAPSLPYLRSLRDEYGALATWQLALAVLVLLAVLALAWRVRREQPLAAWSALWFFPPIVPVAILTTVLWPGFGRYLYLPMAGLAWALASLAGWLGARAKRAHLLRALAVVHVLVLGGMAAIFTRDFASSDALYAAAIEARPDVAMGYGWLGIARFDAGDVQGALLPLTRAAELDPDTHRYLIRAGRASRELGDRAGARAIAERGIARFRGRREEASYRLLAVNAMDRRDPAIATDHLVRCLERWPGRPDCERALIFLVSGAPDAAENRAALRAVLQDTDPALAASLRPLTE
jgi:tetratricopeptide (TPR) repeat protein